ncbi:zinc-finger domain-containing protein [Thermaerobacillus caldiproteolyticus]|uniref:6-phosphogluconate dehydrogenase n=1 Tax=Thermaerobacillus caldiproteolyticus TaxID=247480 RepID=A0A7W0BZ62_9BACL|nr:zinc-finger domain-containing protein [Anoxybacillus caldiproteolyticus]MBA2876411.1 6-phosphogluconate dehydrogenase [Anoxybacillus caldiproteolyticus]QPA32192.1 zinc-finger domain-containing protein [Anoxybacillus caldiproteolyticus]
MREEKANKRKEILAKLNELHHMYCEGCFLKSTFRKEMGKTYAQSFCINHCTVGEMMKQYGEMLLESSSRSVE